MLVVETMLVMLDEVVAEKAVDDDAVDEDARSTTSFAPQIAPFCTATPSVDLR